MSQNLPIGIPGTKEEKPCCVKTAKPNSLRSRVDKLETTQEDIMVAIYSLHKQIESLGDMVQSMYHPKLGPSPKTDEDLEGKVDLLKAQLQKVMRDLEWEETYRLEQNERGK